MEVPQYQHHNPLKIQDYERIASKHVELITKENAKKKMIVNLKYLTIWNPTQYYM